MLAAAVRKFSSNLNKDIFAILLVSVQRSLIIMKYDVKFWKHTKVLNVAESTKRWHFFILTMAIFLGGEILSQTGISLTQPRSLSAISRRILLVHN